MLDLDVVPWPASIPRCGMCPAWWVPHGSQISTLREQPCFCCLLTSYFRSPQALSWAPRNLFSDHVWSCPYKPPWGDKYFPRPSLPTVLLYLSQAPEWAPVLLSPTSLEGLQKAFWTSFSPLGFVTGGLNIPTLYVMLCPFPVCCPCCSSLPAVSHGCHTVIKSLCSRALLCPAMQEGELLWRSWEWQQAFLVLTTSPNPACGPILGHQSLLQQFQASGPSSPAISPTRLGWWPVLSLYPRRCPMAGAAPQTALLLARVVGWAQGGGVGPCCGGSALLPHGQPPPGRAYLPVGSCLAFLTSDNHSNLFVGEDWTINKTLPDLIMKL